MPAINSKLLKAIIDKTELSRSQAYARIQQLATANFLSTGLAAIKFGAELGLPISRYASPDELAQLRHAGAPVAPPTVRSEIQSANSSPPNPRRRVNVQKPKTVPNQVFVVHGRDWVARESLFTSLRALNVRPIEWNSALAMTKKAAPYIGEILSSAFAQARAIVVLLTPDDLAELRPDLLSASDKPYERVLTGQARPNVLFEAGMAFATHADRTVLVQLGTVREFSDTAGRHVVHLSNDFSRRQELAIKLKNAGCDVDMTGSDWVSAGDFTDPQARSPKNSRRRRK